MVPYLAFPPCGIRCIFRDFPIHVFRKRPYQRLSQMLPVMECRLNDLAPSAALAVLIHGAESFHGERVQSVLAGFLVVEADGAFES